MKKTSRISIIQMLLFKCKRNDKNIKFVRNNDRIQALKNETFILIMKYNVKFLSVSKKYLR